MSSDPLIWNRASVWQFCKFVVVGSLNTAFSYLMYAAGLALGLHFTVANLIAMIIGILLSFKSQGALVFNNRDSKLIWRFVIAWIGIWLCNIGLIELLTRFTQANAYVAGALSLAPMIPLSFVVQKFFVFADDPQKKMPPAA